MTIPVIICGALGRMGQAVIDMARDSQHVEVKAGVIRGETRNQSSIPLYNNLHAALSAHKNTVVIDFSDRAYAHEHLKSAHEHRCGFLLATTGHDDESFAVAKKASIDIPIVIAPNTSLMANLLVAFTGIASRCLPQTEISIVDLHHAQKKDAPSGTALSLKQAIKKQKPSIDIEVHSMRKASIAGEHTVYFFNEFDRLELTHRVVDRRVFAEGALLAAQFLLNRSPGLYDMNDVLNLRFTIEK